MKMNMLAPVGVKLAFGSLMAVGLLASQHHAHAAAEPASVQNVNTVDHFRCDVGCDWQPHTEVTVEIDGRDYVLPVCEQEDCSDVPNQVGIWFDPQTGRPWLSTGSERSVRISHAKMGGRVR